MENLNDDDTYVVERAPIKLTPYDRRLKEFRDLSEKRWLGLSEQLRAFR